MRRYKVTRDDVLIIYDEAVKQCDRFDRKGKTMPYTSANGHMFSQLNKDGELGIRFSKEIQEKYMAEYNITYFKSYGAVMKGYILITEKILNDKVLLNSLLNEGYDYVMSLDPK